MEEYPRPITPAGEQASPAWQRCMGRSSAAPEVLLLPSTVSSACSENHILATVCLYPHLQSCGDTF